MTDPRPLQLLAPLPGVLIPLSDVPDPVFAERVIGDGLCIDPTAETLCAPMAGVVSDLQRSGHALTLTNDQGVQVLLHIGLDTVNLAGEGFTAQVEQGQRVEAGQPLIRFDADYIALHARSLMTLMLVASGQPFTALAREGQVEALQPLLELGTGSEAAPAEHAEAEAVFSAPIPLPNANGLHARPAGTFAQAAKGFEARIRLHTAQGSANAKSLVEIMALHTGRGDELRISAAGSDAEAALATLSALLAEGSGEAVTPAPAAPAASPQAPVEAGRLRGTCASAGAAFGQVVQVSERALELAETAADPAAERAALKAALAEAMQALQALRDSAGSEAQAQIFKAHQQLLEDPSLVEQAQALIEQGKSAGFAWRRVTEETAALFRAGGNAFMAERALDLQDVGQRVLKCLLGVQDTGRALPDQAILIADQLTPSQTAALDTSKVLGFATVAGGATSHVAILARALGIPALCGLPKAVLELAEGTAVLLDADAGELRVDPPAEVVQQFKARRQEQQQRQAHELAQAPQPACTRDGHRFEVTANVASLLETEHGMALGGEGVGLLRSEFLYHERASAPTQDEQAAAYAAIARAVGPAHNLVVRTLDVGGDKPLAYVPMDSEANPFLGMRGIRLCLERPHLLREQFRAILASAGLARLHIMLPMISQLAELRLARQVLEEEARAAGLEALPKLGIMVEVPSAALMADRFAPEVDFFSIGTNDLTQYTLAMDRDHPRLASQADSLHPAVLRLIATTVKAAHAHGKWVGVCGALASETLAVPVLLGLGVDELSVSVPLIPAVKQAIRDVELSRCQALAQQVLGLDSAEQVREALREQPQAARVVSHVMES